MSYKTPVCDVRECTSVEVEHTRVDGLNPKDLLLCRPHLTRVRAGDEFTVHIDTNEVTFI